MVLGPGVVIFLSLSLPPPVWIASIRLLCRDVSFSTDLEITGLNFLTGPNSVTSGGSGVTPLSDTVTEDCGFASGVTWVAALVTSFGLLVSPWDTVLGAVGGLADECRGLPCTGLGLLSRIC